MGFWDGLLDFGADAAAFTVKCTRAVGNAVSTAVQDGAKAVGDWAIDVGEGIADRWNNGWERIGDSFMATGEHFGNAWDAWTDAMRNGRNMTPVERIEAMQKVYGEIGNGFGSATVGTLSTVVNVGTLGMMGGSFNEGLNRTGKTVSQGADLIAKGDIEGGIQRMLLGTIDGVVTVGTLGASTDAGHALDDEILKREEKGQDYYLLKGDNWISGVVRSIQDMPLDIYKNGRDYNQNIYEVQVQALEEGDVESARYFGREALKTTSIQVASAAAIAGGVVLSCTGVGASVGAPLTALGVSASTAASVGTIATLASVGFLQNCLDNAAEARMYDFAAMQDAMDMEDALDQFVQAYKDMGYEFSEEQEEMFRHYTEGYLSGYMNDEQYAASIQVNNLLQPNRDSIRNVYESTFQAALDEGAITQEQFDKAVEYSVMCDFGDIDQATYQELMADMLNPERMVGIDDVMVASVPEDLQDHEFAFVQECCMAYASDQMTPDQAIAFEKYAQAYSEGALNDRSFYEFLANDFALRNGSVQETLENAEFVQESKGGFRNFMANVRNSVMNFAEEHGINLSGLAAGIGDHEGIQTADASADQKDVSDMSLAEIAGMENSVGYAL